MIRAAEAPSAARPGGSGEGGGFCRLFTGGHYAHFPIDLMDKPVSTILRAKGDWVITIHPDATVYETISRMVDENVGAVVVARAGELIGIFTERDYLRRIVLQGRTSKTTEVQEVMTRDVVCATPDHTLRECMAMMTEKKCRHLPVLREGRLAGIISIGDCVKALLAETEQQVESLRGFISGEYPQ